MSITHVVNERGLALIAAVAILLIFAMVTALLVSLVSTDSEMALYQFRSGEATYIANGGMQLAMMNFQNYPNFSIPPYSTRVSTPQVLLGSGGFTVDSPGVLSAAVTAAAAVIPAVCFDKGVANVPCNTLFPPTGRILVESELIDYTGVTANSFTGAARGRDGSLAAAHVADRGIYPATGLTAGITNGAATVGVGNTTGFTVPGTIKIDQEYLYCTGRTAVTFTGCARGVQGSRAITHNALATAVQVTMTVNATVPTGITGNAQRIVKGQASLYRDGWVAANGGTISRWNGIDWDTVASGVGVNLNSAFLFDTDNDGAADDGWAVGNAWNPPGPPPLREVILRWTGLSWTLMPAVGAIPDVNLNSVHCVANNDCWAVGNPGGGELLLRWNGATWSRWLPSGSIPNTALNSVYCVANNDCWAMGNNWGGVSPGETILRWTGGPSWVRLAPSAGIPNVNLNSVYCVANNDCWAVGNNWGGVSPGETILRWTGGPTWVRMAAQGPIPNQNLNSVYCVATNDCLAVGNNHGGGGGAAAGETILRWTGGPTWVRLAPSGIPDVNLNSVYCVAANDCWAVGNPSGGGVIVRWNGVTWSRYPSPTGNQLNEVFLLRPTNFLRIGDWQEVY
ncbi:MAG: hypothetical protein WBK96_08130 [Candidatus Manganitrophaceae bacterium]